ncbi:hypothetical protein BGZ61DRAFT_455750 [Ilyonectria robusta]|uniref:uncharacterized protein n=1 Tax=Ilyonectria robusta TaxID=1079257 RepID=UPI001E8D860C|nr:uncharacterized protein BGZ61DRAFT_455750 [Ilyonectria robusta]KAH8684181.1 hypothetical protein BGZ61DRAFT_455750 [Ilyonectria robusta]
MAAEMMCRRWLGIVVRGLLKKKPNATRDTEQGEMSKITVTFCTGNNRAPTPRSRQRRSFAVRPLVHGQQSQQAIQWSAKYNLHHSGPEAPRDMTCGYT